jgi:NADH-quinone oxidoreductase subunit M
MINLILLLIVPLIGISYILFEQLSGRGLSPDKISFITMGITAAVLLSGLMYGFIPFNLNINSAVDFSLSLNINFITIPFLLLVVVLPIPILYFASNEIKENKPMFYLFYLLVYSSAVGVFISSNLIFFFLFWEVAVLSLFFMMSLWGKTIKSRKAGMKFLVFTQFGSLTLLAVFILLFVYTGSFNFYTIASKMSSVPLYIEYVSFFLLLITVMIKMPVFPLHEWLPDAYYYSPTPVTMFLSGILSKFGGFAFILFGFGLFRNILINLRIPLVLLGVLAAIYIALVASGQRDLKMLFSYSSMFYMALVFIGVSSGMTVAVSGAVLLMISHGFVITLLFGISYILLQRTGTNETGKLGGLTSRMPLLSIFFMLAVFASLGIPGLSNFPGELLIFIGTYSVAGISLIAIFGIMISTNYYLRALKEAMFGHLQNKLSGIKDLNRTEVLVFLFISFFILLIGVFPSLLTGVLGGL